MAGPLAKVRIGMGLAGLAAALAGCASDKSFALVTVLAQSGEFPAVAQLSVILRSGAQRDHLVYSLPSGPFSFDATTPVTFTASFTTRLSGFLEVGVSPIDVAGMPLGYGASTELIQRARTTEVTVRVVHGQQAPATTGDGGAPDGGAGTTDGGGRPGSPDGPRGCVPFTPQVCGQGNTCYVSCTPNRPAEGLCTSAGARTAGQACTNIEDCVPGTQCFQFPCERRTCMRFCEQDRDCPAGGLCRWNVPCGTQQTGFKLCTQPCEPTGEATTGCAPGLVCLLFPDESTDCHCRGRDQTGKDGDRCMTSDNCQPGFLCVTQAGVGTCRALCRLDGRAGTPACPAGRTCTKLLDPELKVWGGCLPM